MIEKSKSGPKGKTGNNELIKFSGACISLCPIHITDMYTQILKALNKQLFQYAVKAQTSLAPLSRFRGSRITTAHAHQCCIFQSYAKTVPRSRMKLTMKLTMREPTFMGSMTTDT